MKITPLLISAFALAIPARSETAECTNTAINSYLLNACPSGVTITRRTSLPCGDNTYVYSPMSMQSECYRTYCGGFDLGDGFNSRLVEECGTGLGTAEVTGSASVPGPSTTASSSSDATMGSPASTATSTSSARAEGIVNVAPARGLLLVFIGILANL